MGSRLSKTIESFLNMGVKYSLLLRDVLAVKDQLVNKPKGLQLLLMDVMERKLELANLSSPLTTALSPTLACCSPPQHLLC